MGESSTLKSLDQMVGNGLIMYGTMSQIITSINDLMSSDLDKRHGLAVTRFEADRCTGWNVQAIAASFDTIEIQLRVCLDKVIVRANLQNDD